MKTPSTVFKPKRYPLAGRLVKYSGVIMMFLGTGLTISGSENDEGLLISFGLALIAAGAFNWIRGHRLVAPSAETLLAVDSRPPIVFLRSFGDESSDYSFSGFLKALRTSFRLLAAGTPGTSSTWGPTFQIQLESLLRDIGPYVAIGRPREKMAGTGAARIYVSDAEWQEQIRRWLDKARLIILRPGSSEGVSLELGMLRDWNHPERILLIMPHTDEAYQGFRTVASKILPRRLPEKRPTNRFLRLNKDWSIQELPQKATLFDTLEPFFNQNNITRRDLSIRYRLFNEWLWATTLLAMTVITGSVWVVSYF